MPHIRSFIKVLLVLFGMALTGHVYCNTDSRPIILINDSISSFEISSLDVEVFEDASGKLTVEDIQSLPDSIFLKNAPLYNPNTNSTYWIKFNVKSEFQNKKKWVIEILDSRIFDVELFSPDKEGAYASIRAGLGESFQSRIYGHKNFVMDIDLRSDTITTFYLKFNSRFVSSFLFKIRSNDDFSSYAVSEYYLLGIYYGIIIIISLLNFILFFSLRKNIYLLYSLYVIAWAWNSMLDDGIGYQYIWPNTPLISQIGFVIGRPLLFLLFIFYSKQFLNVEKFSFKYNQWINYSLIFYLVNFVIDLFIPYPSLLSFAFFIAPFIIVYVISFKIYRDGFKPARFFMIGNIFIIMGFIIREIKDLDVIAMSVPVSIISVYSRNVGIVMDICTLFLALGDRFRFMKVQEEKAQAKVIEQLKENEQLSQKVNRELEEKVGERTRELLEKSDQLKSLNEQLEIQSQEISKWNQLLDIDNYKLKLKVKEVQEARIKSLDVPFEEFLQIFPDELSCQRYIDDIKWKEGYACKKCGNTKFSSGPKMFARRCTKCGYSESITAFTFLHKCKFSLVKAFYIMMKVNKYEDDINCAELARELEMRKGTVLEFKNKVLECKAGKQMDLDYLLLKDLK
jgi:hypothetical protein